MKKLTIFWFRRDLRLNDNVGLQKALESGNEVLPLFIFDTPILEDLDKNDKRVSYIYDQILRLNEELSQLGSGLLCKIGKPLNIFREIMYKHDVSKVYCNEDYEPYAINRDNEIRRFLLSKGVRLTVFKDQVIFAKDDIQKKDGTPYTVFTPFKKKWLSKFSIDNLVISKPVLHNSLHNFKSTIPSLEAIGFNHNNYKTKEINLDLQNYDQNRDFPSVNGTSNLSLYLRFGVVSVREIIIRAYHDFPKFIDELIWREFFMQILYHFPHVTDNNFKAKYDHVEWIDNEKEFKLWCDGKTGYPLVDAGMRELNNTGYMHNRVRMITAGFLCKHLLIDWRWGEKYFASKLMDYELSSNNGNWQWSAGTGCDAAPYFRIFNPISQQQKFDKDFSYIKKWIPEYGTDAYPKPVIEHKFARERALSAYKVIF